MLRPCGAEITGRDPHNAKTGLDKKEYVRIAIRDSNDNDIIIAALKNIKPNT